MPDLTIEDVDVVGDHLTVGTRLMIGEGYFVFDAYEDEDSAEVHISLDDARRLVEYIEENLPPTSSEKASDDSISMSDDVPGVWVVVESADVGGLETISTIYPQDQEIVALRHANATPGLHAKFVAYGGPVREAR